MKATLENVKPVCASLPDDEPTYRHTVGKYWVVADGSSGKGVRNLKMVAQKDCTLGNATADSFLLMAAPELLAVLEHAAKLARIEHRQMLDDGWQPESMGVSAVLANLEKYETAIAKAKGQI